MRYADTNFNATLVSIQPEYHAGLDQGLPTFLENVIKIIFRVDYRELVDCNITAAWPFFSMSPRWLVPVLHKAVG